MILSSTTLNEALIKQQAKLHNSGQYIMLSRHFAYLYAPKKSLSIAENFYKVLWCKREVRSRFSPLNNGGIIMTVFRPIVLTTCAFPRVPNIKNIPLGKQNLPGSTMVNMTKRMQKQASKRKEKLKNKLDERLTADREEKLIQESVELVRKRLGLDEKAVVMINTNVDFLISEGITPDIISKMAARSPKGLNLDLKVIKGRIRVFKVNSIYEDSMRKIFKRNPSIISCKLEETLSQKVEMMRGLQLNLSVHEIAKILERCPDIIEHLPAEKLVEKVEFLTKKIGFNISLVRRIIVKNPAVLTMGKESLKEKTDFCIQNFNINHDQVSKYPRVFQAPMSRLNERYLFLKQEGLIGDEIKIRGWAFKNLAANSDEYFAEKIAQKPLKKLRDFQERMRREQEKDLRLSKTISCD